MIRFLAAVCALLLLAVPLRSGSAEGKIVRLTSLGPKSLNPLLSSNTTENALAAVAFDLLVGVDEKGNAIPRLAREVPTLKNGGISKDGLTITYRLRRDVKWHDGVPFTSKDVAFSWSEIMNPRNNVISRRGYDIITRVDTPDLYTAVFHLKERFAPAILTLFSESDQPYRIVPEHILGKLPDINEADFNQHPIGTGPFKFVRWDRGNQIEYAANPDYFLGKPKLDGVIAKEIPDQNTMVVQMKTHAVDFMVAGSAAYEQLRRAPDVKTVLVDVNAYVAVMLNLSRPALRDVNVRRAIATAIDAKAIADKVTFGTGVLATGDLPSFMWAYNGNVRRYKHDPAAARKLLGGKKVSLLFVGTTATQTGHQIEVLVQSMLQAAGFNVEIKDVSPQIFTAPAGSGGTLRSGNFDLANWAWIGGADPDDSSQFMCNQMPPEGNNFTRYCNKAVDRAEMTATASYDRATRKKAYDEIQRHLADEVPMVFLYWPKQRLAYTPALEGVRSNGMTETWNIGEWSLR